jgi:hypothetical protein
MNVLTTEKVSEAVAASPNTKPIAPFVASTCRVVDFRWRVASGHEMIGNFASLYQTKSELYPPLPVANMGPAPICAGRSIDVQRGPTTSGEFRTLQGMKTTDNGKVLFFDGIPDLSASMSAAWPSTSTLFMKLSPFETNQTHARWNHRSAEIYSRIGR